MKATARAEGYPSLHRILELVPRTRQVRAVHRVADPLPECDLCEVPTARAVHDKNGGLYSPCATGIADTVRMLPVGLPPANDDTAYVERYRPPVPPRAAR